MLFDDNGTDVIETTYLAPFGFGFGFPREGQQVDASVIPFNARILESGSPDFRVLEDGVSFRVIE